MRLSYINNYLFILYNFYYTGSGIEFLTDIIRYVSIYNKDFDNEKLKNATFLIVNRALSDGTHYFNSNELENKITYSKKNNNYKEGINVLYSHWDEIIKKMFQDRDENIYFTSDDGYIHTLNPIFYFTEDWKNELCKLSKQGYKNVVHNPNCQYHLNYQYQMPAHRFIPDNDFGCEE